MCFISQIIEIRFYIVCLNCTGSYYIAYMVPNVLPFCQYMTSRYKLFIFKTKYILQSNPFSDASHFEWLKIYKSIFSPTEFINTFNYIIFSDQIEENVSHLNSCFIAMKTFKELNNSWVLETVQHTDKNLINYNPDLSSCNYFCYENVSIECENWKAKHLAGEKKMR